MINHDFEFVHAKSLRKVTSPAALAAPKPTGVLPAESAPANLFAGVPPFPVGIDLPNTAAVQWTKTQGIDGAGTNASQQGNYM